MKKMLLLIFSLLLIFGISPLNIRDSFADTNKIIINTSFSYLYKETSYQEHFDFKINKDAILDYSTIENNFYNVSYVFEDISYDGYIPSEFASPYSAPQETILVYNGKILQETNVYSVADNTLMQDVILPINQEIYIYEGFNSKDDFTKIKFIYNNQVLVGKIPTMNLSPNGVNKTLIISLSIIAALVGTILILLGLSTKKWHKSLKINKK